MREATANCGCLQKGRYLCSFGICEQLLVLLRKTSVHDFRIVQLLRQKGHRVVQKHLALPIGRQVQVQTHEVAFS